MEINYSFKSSKLEEIVQHLSFEWIRLKRMEPEGNQNFEKLETKIDNIYLDMIPNGGVIH